MHTHGTAVLDRPAVATVPAVTSQSAPFTSAAVIVSESAKSTINAAELFSGYDTVFDLGYGELAVALHASGVRPRLFRTADAAQLIEWAVQGLALLGIERVRRYEKRTRYLNHRLYDDCMTARDQAEYARMWTSHKARQACHDAAYRINYPLHPMVSQLAPMSAR